jgi:hypothetical protein
LKGSFRKINNGKEIQCAYRIRVKFSFPCDAYPDRIDQKVILPKQVAISYVPEKRLVAPLVNQHPICGGLRLSALARPGADKNTISGHFA